jgi:hypothetical protein
MNFFPEYRKQTISNYQLITEVTQSYENVRFCHFELGSKSRFYQILDPETSSG